MIIRHTRKAINPAYRKHKPLHVEIDNFIATNKMNVKQKLLSAKADKDYEPASVLLERIKAAKKKK